jgi:NDP-4-keto-2,6-dideoxyhexose 3-C-methyltransferase
MATAAQPVVPSITPRTTCRSCGGPLLEVLSLGPIHLSDFPRSAGTTLHPAVPLTLMRCLTPACGLVQLQHTTPAEWLFRLYWYRSGVNEAMVAELKDIVEQATARVDLKKGDTVVDIGANDGTLLQQYAALGNEKLLTVAWEPAINLYEVLRPHVKVLFPEFFSVATPWEARTKAKVITAIAMFYDLEDPHGFLKGITQILHPEGVFIIQQAYLPAMLVANGFDNVCHEHLEYYDLRALEAVLAPHGLEVVDVDLRRINGGSFRATIRFEGQQKPSAKVARLRHYEAHMFHEPAATFEAFAERVGAVKTQLQAVLQAHADSGGAVDLYAASTKSNTLLQYCGVDARLVRQAWERSPEKWGRYVGTSGIPIVSEAVGREDPPAALLIGAWQWRDYFLQREDAYLQKGGRIIIPLPRVESIEHGQSA